MRFSRSNSLIEFNKFNLLCNTYVFNKYYLYTFYTSTVPDLPEDKLSASNTQWYYAHQLKLMKKLLQSTSSSLYCFEVCA